MRRTASSHSSGLFSPPQQQDKLVAAQPRDGIAAPQHLLETVGDIDQHLVADLVAPGVVDRLEAVEIKIANGHQRLRTARLRNGLYQTVGKKHPVGQLGQRIVIGHLRQLLFLILDAPDVGEHRDIVGQLAAGVMYRRDR
jgi:hypothetical protein